MSVNSLNTFIKADISALQNTDLYTVQSLFGLIHTHLTSILDPEDRAEIEQAIRSDISFFRSNDKASREFDDDIIHSGRQSVIAVTRHRIMAGLLKKDPSLAGTMLGYNRHIYTITGMEIGSKARIGVPFATDHHTLVIGETSTIGDGSFLYHSVTLGATWRDSEIMDRHPHVGDSVWMGLGASVLGQSIIMGGKPKPGRDFNTLIAANVTITDSILEPYVSVAAGQTITNVRIPENHHVVSVSNGGIYELINKSTGETLHTQLPNLTLEEIEAAYLSWSETRHAQT